MEKFDTVFRGYDKEQVHKALDEIIHNYESLLVKSKTADEENQKLVERLSYYEKIENTLNRAIFTAESAGDQIKRLARRESEQMIEDARKNSSRIINDALLKAEAAQNHADLLKRNVRLLKRRLMQIIENQMEVINEIDNINLSDVDIE